MSYDPFAAFLGEALGVLDGHASRALLAEPEAHLGEDGDEHLEQRLLDEAVHYGRHPSIRFPPPGLGMVTRRTGCGR